MPVAWDHDEPFDLQRSRENLRRVMRGIVRDAPKRAQPTVALARDWHRRIYRGVGLPVPYYAGEVRDADQRFPELIGYEVVVGMARGVPSALVPDELAAFEESMQKATARIDEVLTLDVRALDRDELEIVLALCANAHGEWVRIHPFANGNGRIARQWANWGAVRYGLPPFVRLMPRPLADAYARAAAASMTHDHRPMLAVFARLLEETVTSPRAPRRRPATRRQT